MTPGSLEQIIQQGEGLTIEFKQARNGLPRDLFETVCAFLNRQGGHVLLGVQNDGILKGVEPEQIDQLKKEFTSLSNNPNKLNPPFLLDFTEIILSDHHVLYVYVPQSSQVHRCDGLVFDRGHEGDFRISDNDSIGAVYARKSSFYTENRIFPYLDLADFKPGILDKARQLIRSRSPLHPWLALSDQEMLRSAGLYRKDRQNGQEGYTLAAALLFCTDETINDVLPHYRIDALVRIENLDRYDDRLDIRTNLIDAYELLMQFINKHLPDKFYLQGDQRINLREKIFREIVANLIVHREYTNGAPARLIIYADRVETDNANKPHGYGPLNPQTFSPFPKNPDLAKFFLQMGRVDELGSGVRNVMQYTPHYAPGWQAQFIEEDMFRAVIPVPVSNKSLQAGAAAGKPGKGEGAIEGVNNGAREGTDGVFGGVNEGAVETVNETVNETINETVKSGKINPVNEAVKEALKKLVLIIADCPDGITFTELSERAEKSRATLHRYLKILKVGNLVEFKGSVKTGKYYLTVAALEKIDKAIG